ncbi:MAG: DUF2203 domain-containing protein [Phycisphaerales bacterium]|nr:DUF2203 domain-containing protein [Phycisphaerales bacterium]
MDREQSAASAVLNAPGRVFSVVEANRAIVLIRKITQEIVSQYREFQELRREFEELSLSLVSRERIETVRAAIERRLNSLNRLRDELADIGVVLKDYETGLIDFPAMHQGRRIYLCWRHGEGQIAFWHDTDSGFAGRKPIAPDFS